MNPGKALIVMGAVFLVAGLVWLAAGRIGLGHLPGDIVIERGGFKLYLPLGTSVLISLILTVVIWLIGKL